MLVRSKGTVVRDGDDVCGGSTGRSTFVICQPSGRGIAWEIGTPMMPALIA
jgi:hypothetical protein